LTKHGDDMTAFEEQWRRLQKPQPSAISRMDKRRADDSEYARNSKLARIRDGHHCRICGALQALETHHLVPRSLVGKALRHALSNLLTACRECHELVTRHVIRLYAVDPQQGANGKIRVTKYDEAEKGYVTVAEAA
jgi:5-methylcytosine-specific restriction endonuclease McrA